jgi:chromosome segregation ATPase
VEPLLRIVDELERRDEDAAAALHEIEELQRAVDGTRNRGSAIADFLAAFPDALVAREAEERAADESRAGAAESLAEAEAALAETEQRGREDARLAAERTVQHARDTLRDAEHRVERAHAERERLVLEEQEQRTAADRLVLEVQPLAGTLAATPRLATEPPGPGLDGVLEWTSKARGDLLVAHAGLDTERDKVVREATELVASALGEPLPGKGVAGVREQLMRSIGTR